MEVKMEYNMFNFEMLAYLYEEGVIDKDLNLVIEKNEDEEEKDEELGLVLKKDNE